MKTTDTKISSKKLYCYSGLTDNMDEDIELTEDPGSSSSPDRFCGDGETYFERIPLDAILEIFKSLPIDDVVKLKNESSLLNSAVRCYLKYSMIGLRRNCVQVLPWLQDKLKNLPLNQDRLRLDLVKSISLVRFFSKEIEVLFASVWRLRDEEQSWTELAPHLAPVIKEFDLAVTSQTNLDYRRYNLSLYLMRQVLIHWHQFLEKIDSGLDDRLYAMASRKTPYEIHVIDMLMCAPSFNFQLGLRRQVTGGAFYDVYGFFKTINLKPVGQVPDVFNAELNVLQKKKTLLKYLRETVQMENLGFLADLSDRIQEMELALLALDDGQHRTRIWSRLTHCYQMMQESPYAEVMKKLKYRVSKELYEEYYVRCSHENVSYRGLHCVVVVPQQEVWNLPLVVPFLRGRRQKLLDNFETIEMEGTADLSNLIPPFVYHEGDGGTSSSNERISSTSGSSNESISSTTGSTSNNGSSSTTGISGGGSCTTTGTSTNNNSSSTTVSPCTSFSSGSCTSTSYSSSKAEMRGSKAKPKLQLIIHSNNHTSFVWSPSEVLVNIGYDDNDTCYLSYHNLMGEPLHPPRPPTPQLNDPQ